MSTEGIRAVADVFSLMQNVRIQLLQRAEMQRQREEKNWMQDMELAQLLHVGKESMKVRFSEITLE